MSSEKQTEFDKMFSEAMDDMYALGYTHAMGDLKWRKKEFHALAGIGFFVIGYFSLALTDLGLAFIFIGLVEFAFSIYENYKELKILRQAAKAYDQSPRPKPVSKE